MTRLEDLRNVLATIAAIVGWEGELNGRVRLQKLGYLLQQRGFRPLAHVRFAYHHYGPYSDELAGALEQTVDSGLVRENRREASIGRKIYVYELDRNHPDNAHLGLESEDLKRLHAVMQATKDAHWRTLELSATVVYLERNLNIPRHDAFTRALGLKPDCVGYRQQAEGLLSALEYERAGSRTSA